jgi:hypothetical protein
MARELNGELNVELAMHKMKIKGGSMNGYMKNFTAIVTLITAVMAIFAAGAWATFMFTPGPFSSSVTGIDWAPLIVFLAIGCGLLRKTYKLIGPWPKEISWSLASLFVVMALFFIWTVTPLSSCRYFPSSPAKCGMAGELLTDAR